MSVILQVNYTPTEAQAAQTQSDILSAAHEVAKGDGIIWKIWIYNGEERRRGGIYLFATKEQAVIWGENNTRPKLLQAGATDISIQYFDINEGPSELTRAPLGERTTDAEI